MTPKNDALSLVCACARRLAAGDGALSTGERLVAALVLNRADVLAQMNYGIADALDRVGSHWVTVIPEAARVIAIESQAVIEAQQNAANDAALAALLPSAEVDLDAALVTYGHAPGYRDVSFTFDMRPIGSAGGETTTRATIRIRPEDAESIVRFLFEVHRFAWSRVGPPLDAKEGELRPRWLDRV